MKKNYLIPQISECRIALTTTLCGSDINGTIQEGENINGSAPARMNLITK